MLVLSRKQDQAVHIGSNVTITVLEVRGNVVKIGIDAPRNIRILRGELEFEEGSGPAMDEHELCVACEG